MSTHTYTYILAFNAPIVVIILSMKKLKRCCTSFDLQLKIGYIHTCGRWISTISRILIQCLWEICLENILLACMPEVCYIL